jgi:chromosome segregation and condensation protein ScpB
MNNKDNTHNKKNIDHINNKEVVIDSDHIKCAIEAMLFMSPRSVSVSKIRKSLNNIDKDLLELEINELIKDYNKRTTALKIVYENKKVEMVLKQKYINYRCFALGKTLSKSELKTLALISLNSPVYQSKITKRRPYDHLVTLKELDLIKVTKEGRKNVLSTTKKFNVLYNKKINIKKEINK